MMCTRILYITILITIVACSSSDEEIVGEPVECESTPRIDIFDNFNTVGVATLKTRDIEYKSLQENCIDTSCTKVAINFREDSTYTLKYQIANELTDELYSVNKNGKYALDWCYVYEGGLAPGQWKGKIILNPGEADKQTIPFIRNLWDHPLSLWIDIDEGELYLWVYER